MDELENGLEPDLQSLELEAEDTELELGDESLVLEDGSLSAPAHDEPEKAPQPETAGGPGAEDYLRFAREFPDVKPGEIPPEVWEQVRRGGDLTGVYALHENRRLRSQLQALEQNHKNAQRSTGSRQSAGNHSDRSLLEQLWYQED